MQTRQDARRWQSRRLCCDNGQGILKSAGRQMRSPYEVFLRIVECGSIRKRVPSSM